MTDRATNPPLDVDANLLSRLDRAPLTRTLGVGLGVLVLVWLIESFDIGIVSTLLLVLKPHWGLDATQVGLLAASGTIGLVAGIVPAGRLADLLGRKKVLLLGTTVFAVFTALCALSTNFWMLFALRIIAGLGEGAIFPVPYMMISELVGRRTRGRIMGYAQWVLNAGYTLPALVGLWTTTQFSVDWSWRVPLIIGGFPVLLLPALKRWVPESPRYLLKRAELRNRSEDREAVRSLVEQIETEANLDHDEKLIDPQILDVLTATATRDVRIRTLFCAPYLQRSAIAYAALTSSFIIWYTMLTYAPTIFKGLFKASSHEVLLLTAIMMLVSGFGVFFQGRWGDRWGRRRVFAIYILMGGAGMIALPFYDKFGVVATIIAGAVIAWFGLGSFSLSKMYMAEQYPTRLRGLGTSTGEMISRALTGGVLVYFLPQLFDSWGVKTVFIAGAVIMVALMLPMAVTGVETSGKNMEVLGTSLATTAPAATMSRLAFESARPGIPK